MKCIATRSPSWNCAPIAAPGQGRGHEHCCCGRNCGQQPLRCSPTRRVSSIQDSGLRRGYRGEAVPRRSEEHTSELQSLMRISYAVVCLKKKRTTNDHTRLLRKTL